MTDFQHGGWIQDDWTWFGKKDITIEFDVMDLDSEATAILFGFDPELNYLWDMRD